MTSTVPSSVSLVCILLASAHAWDHTRIDWIKHRNTPTCDPKNVKEKLSCHMIQNGPISVDQRNGIPQDSICISTDGECYSCNKGILIPTDCHTGVILRRKKRIAGAGVLFLIFWGAALGGMVTKTVLVATENRKPSIYCQGFAKNFIAPALSTKVRVNWDIPTARDDDSRLRIRRISGEPSGSMFGEGTHRVAYKVTDKGGLTDTCSFSFKITVIRCESLSTPRHGIKHCDNTDNVYGTTCRFSCEDGYWLDGKMTSECLKSGNYSNQTPTCKKKRCTRLFMPPNAVDVQCTETNHYNSLCLLRCLTHKGYVPRHQNRARCNANRVWSYSNWYCDDIEKPKILNCPGGQLNTYDENYEWPRISATDNSGKVILNQVRGPLPTTRLKEGSNTFRYEAVDPSGNEAEPCVFRIALIAVNCQKPVQEHIQDPVFNCNGHKPGSTCHATCDRSRVIGAKYIRCDRNNSIVPTPTWVGVNGSFPACFACTKLDPPINGAMVCLRDGSRCQLQCKDGYDIPQSISDLSFLVCGLSGWKPAKRLPDCTIQSFPDEYHLKSILHYFLEGCWDNKTTSRIKEQFLKRLSDLNVLSCLEGECEIDHVEVTCGPLEEYEDNFDDLLSDDDDYYYYYYDDDQEGVIPSSEDMQSDESYLTKSRRHRRGASFDVAVKLSWVFKSANSHLVKEKVKRFVKDVKTKPAFAVNGDQPERIMMGKLAIICGPGKAPSNTSKSLCVECPSGTFHNQKADTCDPCPVHSFSMLAGQTTCTRCGQRTGTKEPGSRSQRDCVERCTAGHFSSTGLAPCTPCPLGTYQPEAYKRQCIPCPSDSSTFELGSTAWKKCVPFDVMAKGPVKLNLGQVTTKSTREITLAFWIRSLASIRKDSKIIFLFYHPYYQQLLRLELNDTVNIKMRTVRLPMKTIPFDGDHWTHVALVWKGYPSLTDVYIGGTRVGHYTRPTGIYYLPSATELIISIEDGAGAIVREVLVFPGSNQRIASLAKNCSSAVVGSESLVSRMVVSNSTRVSMVVPSVCSGIDRCDPNPCPGHYCRSFKDGFRCTCRGGYSGLTCNTPPNYCVTDNKCQNKARCKNIENGVNCSCSEDFRGQYCQTPIVHGNWGAWSSWTPCSLTCGGGKRTRSRECNNPPPDLHFGKSCRGTALQFTGCSFNTCPECRRSQLRLGKGVRASCSVTPQGIMNCSVSCADGLVFQSDPPVYTCRDEVWVPGEKTVSCVEIKIPRTIGFNYTVPYKTRVRNRKISDLSDIKRKASYCAARSTCVTEEVCSFVVAMATCQRESNRCREFPEGYKVTIKFTADVISRGKTGTVTGDDLIKTWKSLNDTYNDLEAMHDDCLVVKLTTHRIRPGIVVVDSELLCPEGSVPDQGYCSSCPPGTREESRTCVQCERGWFQEDSGQLTCTMCPAAFSTRYLGSSFQSECIAPPADATMLLSDRLTGHMWTVNMTDFTLVSIPLPGNVTLGPSVYDPVTRVIYYVDESTSTIRSYMYSIKHRPTVFLKLFPSTSVGSIAIDSASKIIFYTDNGNNVIRMVSMETNLQKIVTTTGAHVPQYIEADPLERVLYWCSEYGVSRVNYDGSDQRLLLQSGSSKLHLYALDFKEKMVFWINTRQKTIEVLDIEGGNTTVLLSFQSQPPSSLSVFGDYLFYTTEGINGSIVMRMNKDGTGNSKTELSSLHRISDMNICIDYKYDDNVCSVGNSSCSHLCFPTSGGNRFCACADGYAIKENKFDCRKNTADRVIFVSDWSEPGRIILVSQDHVYFSNVPIRNISRPVAIAYDQANDMLYWTDVFLKQIRRTNILTGFDSVLVQLDQAARPNAIAVDFEEEVLFYTDAGNDVIAKVNMNIKVRQALIYEDLDEPRAIAIHQQKKRVYWTDCGGSVRIEVADFDGTHREVLVSKDLHRPNGITIDKENERLYWCDGGRSVIESVQLDGTDRTLVLSEQSASYSDIFFYQGTIYFTDWNRNTSVLFVSTNGSDVRSLVFNDFTQPTGIYVALSSIHTSLNDSTNVTTIEEHSGSITVVTAVVVVSVVAVVIVVAVIIVVIVRHRRPSKRQTKKRFRNIHLKKMTSQPAKRNSYITCERRGGQENEQTQPLNRKLNGNDEKEEGILNCKHAKTLKLPLYENTELGQDDSQEQTQPLNRTHDVKIPHYNGDVDYECPGSRKRYSTTHAHSTVGRISGVIEMFDYFVGTRQKVKGQDGKEYETYDEKCENEEYDEDDHAYEDID